MSFRLVRGTERGVGADSQKLMRRGRGRCVAFDKMIIITRKKTLDGINYGSMSAFIIYGCITRCIDINYRFHSVDCFF